MVPPGPSVAAAKGAGLAIVEMNRAVATRAEQNRHAASTGQAGSHDNLFFLCIVAQSGFDTGPPIQHDATLAVRLGDMASLRPIVPFIYRPSVL